MPQLPLELVGPRMNSDDSKQMLILVISRFRWQVEGSSELLVNQQSAYTKLTEPVGSVRTSLPHILRRFTSISCSVIEIY